MADATIVFLSQILGRHVRDRDGRTLGRLGDVAVRIDNAGQPRVSQLVLASDGHRRLVVSAIGRWHLAENVLRLRDAGNARDVQVDPDNLCLKAELLDREAIDLERERVVRINDLGLTFDGARWVLAGADVGVRGLVRRLGLERLVLALRQSAHLTRAERVIPWASIDPMETALARPDIAWRHDAVAQLPLDEQARCIAGLQPGLRRRATSLLGLTQA